MFFGPKGGRARFGAVCGVIFLWMLLLNCLTPYLADDLAFAYAFDTGMRLHSLPQLLGSLAYHYHEWSGRVVVKFFAQGFTMLPKAVFNLCNAGAYLGLGLVIYRLARGRRSGRYDLPLLLLIFAALWEISPAFGQTNLWMCGACNYLWATLGCLCYLLPWGYWVQRPFQAGWRMALGMAVAGVLAGWLSENTSAGMLVCLVLCLGLAVRRQGHPPLWMVTGLLGSVAGFVILIAARGNYNRAATAQPDYESFLTRYAARFFNCLNMLKDYALPLLLVFAVGAVLVFTAAPNAKAGARALVWPCILLLGGLGANFAMILSKDYYPRSTHGVFALLTAACAACLVRLDTAALRRAMAAGAGCVLVLCAIHGCEAGYDIASYYVMDRTRDGLIRQEAAAGQTEIISYGIEPYTRWCGAWGLPDIRESCEDSIGLGRCRWYGVASLTATEVHTYPFPGHTNEAWAAGEAAETAQNEAAESP